MLRKTANILKNKNKIILVHGNADMDAIGSAYALSKSFPPADICAPGGMDRVSKIVADKLGFEPLESCDLSDYELVVVVDTSSPEQLKPLSNIPEGSVIIDHHTLTEKWNNMHFLCDETKVSCCEIIKELMEFSDMEIAEDAYIALLGGMLTDSGHFQFANTNLLRTFAEILETSGISMDEVMNLTKSQMSMSERIAVLKSIERSKFERIGDMIVATSYGGSFEASSCRAIMLAGADVVFVGSQRDEEFRLSARASQEMTRRGIHLGNIMGDLSGETDTDGGGHGGAAGMSGVGDVEAMLHMCMMRTMDEFRDIKAKMFVTSVEKD